PVPVDAASGFQVDRARLAAATGAQTGAAILASPSNPTGTVLERAALTDLVAWAEDVGVALVMDEIYQGLVYDAEAPSALEITPELFVINSFSKYFGMTGWRLGWIVAPEQHVAALDKLAQNLFLAAPTPAQHAALAAFEPQTLAILEQRREAFRERRDFLLPALRDLGFEIPVQPQGAFYIYADCSRFTDDSFGFCRRLLEEAGVAITPGLDFGDYQPETHVRFAYTTSLEQLKEGVRRLSAYLASGGD
ncbi:MAG TPA: aminotransferase class I/II-fold pyridoxal phosphate-dependent enzyme, partial [Alphaproteobacteria bacterium]|nr:aminotransferase class I/II-fold pyridoxal phosphate-dependent enzyme [Alphaproteobacteria bacterium]